MAGKNTLFYSCYQSVGVLVRKIKYYYHHIITWVKFKSLCSEFYDFITFGIPFVEVSRTLGGNIYIGKSFWMNNKMSNNQIGYGETPCVLRVAKGNIKIGDNVGLSQTTLVAHYGDICIGNNTKIGSGVKIYTTDFHSLDYLDRRDVVKDQSHTKHLSVTIGEDCFIGAGSFILKGVSIGDRCIIGAGSVVTKSMPSDCVAGGNPCRILKINKGTVSCTPL